jgi:hypothetical protein
MPIYFITFLEHLSTWGVQTAPQLKKNKPELRKSTYMTPSVDPTRVPGVTFAVFVVVNMVPLASKRRYHQQPL